MGGTLQLVTAIILLTKEFLKYLSAREESHKDKAFKVRNAADAIKTARKTKDTSGVESAFMDLGLVGPKLPDKTQ